MSRRTPINYNRADHIAQTNHTKLLQNNNNLLSELSKGSNLGINTLFNNHTLSSSSLNTATIDLGDISKTRAVHIFGDCSLLDASDYFEVMGSNNNVDYYRILSLQPHIDSITSNYHFSHNIDNITRYIRIQNPGTNAILFFTLHYNHLVN